MDDKLITAGRGVARALLPSENDIDASIMSSCTLLTSIVSGRLAAGLAAEVVQDAVGSAMRGLMALGEARAQTVTCHRQLANVRDALGADEQDFGCSLHKTTGAMPRRLRRAA